jgi:glycosyltransferase involved in cell wall biosynthesis
METKALISVIIPNFNRGDLLKETLESVLKQSYPYWEAIVVDDGSTDNSESVGLEYTLKDSRIKYYKRTQESGGAPFCRNIGIQKSTGDYLIFLDSDDLLASFCLEQRINQIASDPENDFWVFPMLMFLGKPESACKLWNINTPEPDLHRFLKLDAVWQTSGPVWRKNAVIKINGFTEGLACWQDVDIHLKALISGLSYKKFYQLKPDVFYRQHETGSISQNEISSPAKMKSRK